MNGSVLWGFNITFYHPSYGSPSPLCSQEVHPEKSMKDKKEKRDGTERQKAYLCVC